MKKIFYIILGILISSASLVYAANPVTFPINGGTGTSSIPTFGQVLVGNSGGTYTLTATSSLGISGGSGTNYFTNSGSNTYLNTGSNLEAPYFTATSTTATSTFAGPLTLATTTTSSLNGTIVVSTKTSTGINTAVSQCGQNGIGNVYIPKGTYTVNGPVVPVSNCHVYGAGKGITIMSGGNSSNWDFINSGSTELVNFSLTDLTIDLQNTSLAGGVNLLNASSSEVSRVAFMNSVDQELQLGTTDATVATVTNFNNKFIDDDFTNQTGTLEAFLLYNTENTQIERSTLNGISSPGIGLYQNDLDTHISNFYCNNSTNGNIYYALSDYRITIDSPNFNNCGGGIQGANVSDNGEFGTKQVQGLKITNPVIIGGANSLNSTGIEIGAVNDFSVINPYIEYEQTGVSFDGGRNATTSSTNGSIIGGTVANNNSSNDSFALHPGILFSTSTPSTLNSNILIEGVQIYDNQSSHTQEYPIVFDSENGAIQYNGITIINNQLQSYFGGASINLANSTTLGPLMNIYANTNYLGTNPTQAWIVNNSNIGIGTTTPGSLLSIGNTGGINFNPTATSTFSSSANGINITNGCFAIGGVCIGGTSISTPVSIANGGTATTTQVTNGINFFDGTRITSGTKITWDGSNFNTFGGILSKVIGGAGSNITLIDKSTYGELQTFNTFPLVLNDQGNAVAIGGTHVNTGRVLTVDALSNGNLEQFSDSGGGDHWHTSLINTNSDLNFTETGVADNRLVLRAGGNIGIGTSTPGTLLSLGNTGANTSNISVTSTSTLATGLNLTTGCLTYNGGACIGAGGGGSGTVNSGVFGQATYYGANGTTVSGTTTLVFGTTTADANNIGIGTTSPTTGALVVQPLSTAGAGVSIVGLSGQNGDLLDVRDNTGTNFMSVDKNGTLNAYQQIQFNGPTFAQFQDTQAGAGMDFKTVAGTGNITFTPNATTIMTLHNNGNVGIGGTSTPYANLSVQSGLSTGDAFAVATSSAHAIGGYDNDGHKFTSGYAPVISSCGTGTGTVVGDDQSGTITTATAATACTMTFAKAYRLTPSCTVTDNSLVGFADISTISTSAVTFGISSALTGGNLYYNCQYHK